MLKTKHHYALSKSSNPSNKCCSKKSGTEKAVVLSSYRQLEGEEMTELQSDGCAKVKDSPLPGDFEKSCKVDDTQHAEAVPHATTAATFYPPTKSMHDEASHPRNGPITPARPICNEYALAIAPSVEGEYSRKDGLQVIVNVQGHAEAAEGATESVSSAQLESGSHGSNKPKSKWRKAIATIISATRFKQGLRKGSGVLEMGGKAGDMDLEGIWTPAYYGDEEDFVEKEKNIGENWVVFSTKDGRLLLKKGPRGKPYPIKAQYEVEIDNHVVTGRLLSELMRNVQKETCASGVANQRQCAPIIYFRDLKRLAGFKEITPCANKEYVETVGMGEFGEVVVANYTQQVNGKTTSRQVAVKKIKQTSKNALVGAMEVAIMCALVHDSTINNEHLLTLFGWYLDDEYLCVVTEFMPGGTLLAYLHSLEPGDGEEAKEKMKGSDYIHYLEMHRFVSEIASGMRALEAKRIQHCDLAARNILLTQHRRIKIGDFGLSRPEGSMFTFDRISTRWTAPEVLESEANFTLRSDVWSFGVVVWEVYSLGGLPYSEVPSRELLTHLRSGRRLDPPCGTPFRIANLMNNCWQLQPSSRPSFADIGRYLHGFFVQPDSDISATKPPPLPARP